jgi:peptidoglycan/LPS O-acetylase OafA/YrhL
VMLFHTNFASHLYPLPLVRDAYLSVDFFFVLSGFVIAHAYARRIEHGHDAGSFLIRRIGRVWPLHIAMLAVLVGIELVKLTTQHFGLAQFQNVPFTGPNSPYAVITNIFLLQSLDLHPATTWNYPAWSISAELCAYLLFAVVLIVARRWALWAAAGVVATAILVIVMFSDTAMDLTFHLGAVRGCLGFFLGWLAYAAHQQRPRSSGSTTEMVVAFLIVGYFWVVGRSALGFAAPFLFAITIYLIAGGRGLVTKVLSSRPLQFLGRISYSIYMTHVVVLLIVRLSVNLAEHVLHRTLVSTASQVYGPSYGHAEVITIGGPWVLDIATFVAATAIIAISAVTYRYIEEPGRRLFARLADRRDIRLVPNLT